MTALFTLSKEQKTSFQEIGKKYNIRFIVVHGSYAMGSPHQGSGLNVVVLGYQFMSFDILLGLHGLLAGI